MRDLITWNLMTLDGFFEGPKSWDLDFHEHAWGDELERFSIEQLRSVGALLFGRVTYQGMADYWRKERGEIADFMNSLPKVVFSRTLPGADWNNTRLVSGDPREEVASLKEQQGKDLYIFGSANLCASLDGLIDEYRIGLAPAILGGGNPLFKPGSPRTKMKLLEARPLATGCVILRYRPER